MHVKEPIAIVGIGCRFPGGCRTTADFWDLLNSGDNVISEISSERWPTDYFSHPDKNAPGKSYTFAAGQIDDVYHFAPEFFGISPREAMQMDPQHRLLLEMTWDALEDGGQIPSRLAGSNCSVFIGISSTDYANNHLDDPNVADSYFMTGNTLSVAANRISYVFDLHGPSMAIDTACSSSLVALHQACNSIWSGESPCSIAGSVHLLLSPFPFIGFSKASMLSESNRCQVYDSKADGYVRSEGGGVLYLKPLSQAEKDGDPIHAVILETAVNTDGRNSGLTIPNGRAQAELLMDTYNRAGIQPDDIDYVEAHGTGTPVGDPIEAGALGTAIAVHRAKENPLPIGSVKSNIGHLEPASGIAGLLKVVLAMKHRCVPASLNHETNNPEINCDELNLKIVDKPVSFGETARPLQMGVSSFGFGGSNAHAILKEHVKPTASTSRPQGEDTTPLVLSAATMPELKNRATQFHHLLSSEEGKRNYYDISSTAANRRQLLNHGLVAYGEDVEEIRKSLQDFSDDNISNKLVTFDSCGTADDITFVFSGNGSQWQGMAKGLLKSEIFRKTVNEINDHFQALSGWSIISELEKQKEYSRLEYTEVAQPLLFAVQVGIVQMLRAEGIQPGAVIGHSVGEVAAAWTAGSLSLETAVRLIYHRSAAQEKTRGLGKMLAVQQSAEEIQLVLEETALELDLAAVNSPYSVTVAGAPSEISKLVVVLREKDIVCHELELDYGFHSSIMEKEKAFFLSALDEYSNTEFTTNYYSTVTGSRLGHEELDKDYWWRNLREEVKFAPAISGLLDAGHSLFLEIGPHPVLNSYINECMRSRSEKGHIFHTLRRGNRGERDRIKGTMYRVSLASRLTGFSRYFPYASACTVLPPYPWNKSQYVFERSIEGINRMSDAPLLGVRQNNTDATWSNLIDTALFTYLADHVIDGAIVFPATAYVEMALSCSNILLDRSSLEVQDLQIDQPMVLEPDISRETLFKISRDDYRFSIMSRERLDENGWVIHASGRLVSAASSFKAENINLDDFIHMSDGEMPGHLVYAQTETVNFNYGPSFQGIELIWLGEKSALAKIDLTDKPTINQSGYSLHPAITDSVFHILFPLISLRDEWDSQRACIPVQIGNIQYDKESKSIEYGFCRISKLASNTVTASFLLLDGEGSSVASLSNCIFKAVPVSNPRLDSPAIYNIDFVPKNHIHAELTTPLPRSDELDAHIQGVSVETAMIQKEVELVSQVLPLFDALASALTENAMNKLGAHLDDFTVESLLTLLDISGEQKNYVVYLLEMLEKDGKARRNGEIWSLIGDGYDDDPMAIWRSILADSPEYIDALLALSDGGFNLVENLCRPFEQRSLQSDASTRRNKGLTRTRSLASYLLSEVIKFVQIEWPAERRRLRIAEIKYANSRVSTELLSKLPGEYCDYEIIAGDDLTEIQANELLGHIPNVTISRMDINATELASGYREGEFDIIIMPHSLHYLDYLQGAFANLLSLLASRGILLIQEESPSRMTDLTRGIDLAWWSNTVQSEQFVSRLNNAEDLLNTLELGGFEDTRNLTANHCENTHEYLIAARRPVRVAKELVKDGIEGHSFLLLAESTGYPLEVARGLSDNLSLQGLHATTVVNASGPVDEKDGISVVALNSKESIDGLFNGLIAEGHTPDNVLFITDSGVIADASEKDISLQIAGSTERVITLTERLANFVERSQVCFWLVSSHAIPASANGRYPEIKNPADASLWGLGRVIRNEYPDLDLRQIDIHCNEKVNKAVKLLATEILKNDGEEEVVLTENLRNVARLQEVSGFQASTGTSEADNGFQLSLDRLSKTSRLVWENKPRKVLQEDELEIDVVASGINFRDIMFASGLLPEQMLEDGFAGANLGLECSGVVRAVGHSVTRFQPGDEVIAYAPASFSSHVVCRTSSVVHKPATWTFEQGATIATAFFTVQYSLEHLARAKSGERLLIHGATGAVGLAAIQYANYRNLEVYATAGSAEKRQFLRLLGIEHVYDSRTLDFADHIMRETNEDGIDIVLNTLSGDALPRNFSVLKPFGRFVELGKRDIYENTRLDLRPLKNNITYHVVDADQVLSHRPELGQQIFEDVMQLFQEGHYRPLAHSVFHSGDVENAFAYMQQSKHVGKIVLSFRQYQPVVKRSPATSELVLSPDFTYLITGGGSGLGLETARWMVGKGARQLVLIGRTGVKNQDDRDVVDEMVSQGVNVKIELCDINNAIALQKVLRGVNESRYPLKGIVHSAMVLDDCVIKNLTVSSLLKVLRPKVNGAWNLHNLTLDKELDFFIMYSSATTCIGNPGQANYVIANTFLESLARYRRERGLPALTVSWDALLDTGYLSRDTDLKNRFTKQLGIQGIFTQQAFTALEKLMLCPDVINPIVINPDWPKMRRSVAIAHSHSFSIVMHGIDDSDSYSGEDIQELLSGLSENEKHVVVTDILTSELAKILHISDERIELHKPIQEIGIDSLMGMELATVINKRFGVEIPLMILANNISIDALAKRLIRALTEDVGNEIETDLSTTDMVTSLATTHAEDVSGEDVAAIAEFVDKELNSQGKLH